LPENLKLESEFKPYSQRSSLLALAFFMDFHGNEECPQRAISASQTFDSSVILCAIIVEQTG